MEDQQRILVINPNSNPAVTRGLEEALKPLGFEGGPELVCQSLAEGPFGIESQADDWAASLDVDVETSRSGNVLTMVFEDNTHLVVNSQAAMQELWVAARSGGFHYRYDGQHWNDTRGGPNLPDALSQICSAAAGVPVTIRL